MRFNFRNPQAEVRNGWKSALFILAAMACFVVVGVVGHALPAWTKPYAPSAILITVLGLAITFAAARLEGSSLAGLGLRWDGRFARQFGLGLLAGALMILASAGLVCSFAGVTLTWTAPPPLATEAKLVAMFLGGALFEELLFRGYAFQRAVRGMGRWPAIGVFSVLFCLGHVPGNLEVGPALLTMAMVNLVLDCVTQSLILFRTGSLALPIGLHFGWNLLQQTLGFGVSGTSTSPGWFRVELGAQPGWLTGGEFGLEASVFAVVVQTLLLAWLLWSARSPVRGVGKLSMPA